jgi:hypothetical protein
MCAGPSAGGSSGLVESAELDVLGGVWGVPVQDVDGVEGPASGWSPTWR